jgi:hypothetical protein
MQNIISIMPIQTADRLERNSEKIMNRWNERATQEAPAAIHQTTLALKDSLPEYLDQLVDALSNTTVRTGVQVKWDRDESTRIANKHGRERAQSRDYTLQQLIFEYHTLRQAICEIMEQQVPLLP